ncbi:hypothetical protein ACA910_001702 [Epithemia clementina (nom. ined.)]
MLMTSENTAFGENASFGIGLSDTYLFIISLVGFGFLGFTMFSVIMLRLKTREEVEKDDEKNSADYEARLLRSDVVGLSRAERRARARAIMKQQRRVQPERRNEQEEEEAQEQVLVPAAPAAEPQNDGDESKAEGPHLSRKEREKKAKAAEKEERKRMQEERQKQQKEVELTAQQERREREKRQMIELENERQKQRRLREETEQRRLLEIETFLTTDRTTLLVDEWIKELKSIRSVSIEDLASRFEIPSERVVVRIRKLIVQQRIAGVITESGRFVYFSEDELGSIIQRVARKDIASKSDIATICKDVVSGEGSGT